MASRETLYGWANDRFDGTLDQRLRAWRDAGLTIDQIVDELRALEFIVSRETVRRWINDAVSA